MSTSITPEDVRKGDTLRTSWTDGDAKFTMEGVANKKDGLGDWQTPQGAWLVATRWRKDQKIELLERPKTPEEILAERRDNLAKDLGGGSRQEKYGLCSPLAKAAIDYALNLEDEKEALTK